MSTLDSNAQLKHGKRLTEAQKRAIVASVAVKGSMQLVAQEFGVHRNTVAQLVNSVRQNVKVSELSGWRDKLTNELPAQSVDAIQRSINDLGDPHKAASTALSHLKGIGALQGDQAIVNVMVNAISSLPPDLAGDYLEVEPTTTCGNPVRHNDATDVEST